MSGKKRSHRFLLTEEQFDFEEQRLYERLQNLLFFDPDSSTSSDELREAARSLKKSLTEYSLFVVEYFHYLKSVGFTEEANVLIKSSEQLQTACRELMSAIHDRRDALQLGEVSPLGFSSVNSECSQSEMSGRTSVNRLLESEKKDLSEESQQNPQENPLKNEEHEVGKSAKSSDPG